ncbi:MAG: DNA polymerase III subunit beta [Chlorobi bacterium]|nr:DNA polymerase III subunit beta [Chlorobiota bacterium]
MNFIVSSTELLSHLQAVNKVISSKTTLPILNNFLFKLEGSELTITASDLETTLVTKLTLNNSTGEGSIAIEAKRITEALKEFPEQPLTFNMNTETMAVEVLSQNGKFSMVGFNSEDFPNLPQLNEEQSISVKLTSDILLNGVSKTIFATADDELRPVMNGIFFELNPENLTFVASDAHKLVRYRRADIKNETEASFILPHKPASLLKNILNRDESIVNIDFDNQNAVFSFSDYRMICRLVEGKYPSYDSVIPTNNPNKLTIDRVEFYNTIKRVSFFSNQASNLIKINVAGNQLTISAQDIDFSISAYERLNCQYDGDEMEIGFKSTFLQEILANLSSTDILMELSDPTRAGIIFPLEKDNDDEDVLMLLMPMMISG